MKKIFILWSLFFSFYILPSVGGQNLVKKFFKLSCSEKSWVITHLFSAKKAFKITLEARKIVDSLNQNKFLDNDSDGGQVDAFRHTYWMARLGQEISEKSAISLGEKHEKANYNDFKKNKNIPIFTHDKPACDMDLHNNRVGVKLGKEHPNISKDSLIMLVVAKILQGETVIIKKDTTGNSLDAEGNILPKDSIIGIWETKRVLIPSFEEK